MIQSFANKQTERIYKGTLKKGFPADLLKRATVKLDQIDAANTLDDLRLPMSNHLEALSGDRVGQNSIRINGQWRICFRWENGHAHDVAITDYH